MRVDRAFEDARAAAAELATAHRLPAGVSEPFQRTVPAAQAAVALRDLMTGPGHGLDLMGPPPWPAWMSSAAAWPGARVRILVPSETIDGLVPQLENLTDADVALRVLRDAPASFALVDDVALLVPAADPADNPAPGLGIVRAAVPLRAMRTVFDHWWERGLPVGALGVPAPADGVAPGPAAVLSAGEERLLALLLTGLTDEAVARHLGVSTRTAQRRVAALIERLGAATRFQAGMAAALLHGHDLDGGRSRSATN